MRKNNNKHVEDKKMYFVMGGGKKRVLAAAVFIVFIYGSNTCIAEESKLDPTLGDNSGYTLNPVTSEESNVKAFTYDSESQKLTTQYYQIDIKRDSQGTGNKIQYYEWSKSAEGGDLLEPVSYPTAYMVYYDEKDHYNNTEPYKVTGTGHIIEKDFIGNHITSGNHNGNGIYNEGGITSIVGAFIHNYSKIESGAGSNNGGAVNNTTKGDIGSIKGNFIGNFISAVSDSNGGAILNNGHIGNIEGNFISNYSRTIGEHNGYGGAIYNVNGVIDSITGDFIDNQAYANRYADGGAIFNSSGTTKITKIKGDFVGNNARGYQGLGGAIFDIGGISNIEGNFIHNYTYTEGDLHDDDNSNKTPDVPVSSQGGAIIEYAQNRDVTITGDFYGNYAQSIQHEGQGGAVYANSKKGYSFTLNSDFYHNYIIGNKGAKGGAIYNAADATVYLNGKEYFLNHTNTESDESKGGAIYNEGIINNLSNVTFVQNYAESKTGSAQGGAIWTNQDLTISANAGTSEFTNNYVNAAGVQSQEAIYVDNAKTLTLSSTNKGKILFNDIINGSNYNLNLTGDNTDSVIIFNNKVVNANATLENVTLKLGANDNIFNESVLNINSGFVDTADNEYIDYNFNELNSKGSGKYTIDINLSKDTTEDKADTFNISKSENGSYIDLSNVAVNTLSNYKDNADNEEVHIIQIIKSADGNIQLKLNGEIQTVTEAAAEMTSQYILAKEFGLYTKETTNDSIKLVGWRDNLAAWSELEVNDGTEKIFTIKSGDTQNLTRNIEKFAGKDIKIIGEGSNTLNVNNKNLFDDIKEDQNVYLSNFSLKNADKINNHGSMTFENIILEDSSKVSNNKDLIIKGNTDINGTITADSKGNLTFDNSAIKITGKVENQQINNNNSETTLVNIKDFANNGLTMNGGNFNITNLGLNNLSLNNLNLKDGNINIDRVDVDLKNSIMGRITADKYNIGKDFKGEINIKDMNITSDSEHMQTVVDFADEAIKNYVNTQITEAPTAGQQWNVYSPIYKYTVEYSADGTHGNNGYFVFSRGNTPTGNDYDGFNPAVLPSAVASQAGGYAAVNESFNYAFEHADTFSALPSYEKYAMLNANKYAITEGQELKGYVNEINHNSTWVKPYATFENIPLKNGPDVDTITYGTLVGTDGDIKELKHGWSTVSTAYIGYNGSSQHYRGVDTTQNGGLLGLTQTFYKNNFYSAITASVGAAVGESSTMYGNEDFTMLLSGVASKSGYSFEFNNGKFIIQPTLLLAYTFVNTFDYTNAAGVRIDSDPLHSIQVRPNIKFVANTENGWQPYISAGVVYNIMDKTEVNAINGTTDVRLPNMSVKPYAEYGIGIQKRWNDKYTGYAQAMARSGGRNGVALTFGFRWTLGDDKKIEKVEYKKENKNITFIAKLINKIKNIQFSANCNVPYTANKL